MNKYIQQFLDDNDLQAGESTKNGGTKNVE